MADVTIPLMITDMADTAEDLPNPEVEVEMSGADLDADKPYVFANKIRYALKADDQEIIDKIRHAADEVFKDMFSDALDVIDTFYRRMRVPTGQTENGRPTWQTDQLGRPIERLDQLTGQDMDQTILDLQRIMLELSPRVNELRLEALFAQGLSKDSFDDSWPLSGTQGDRNTHANNGSRVDRWHFYFTYYRYSTANVFFQEVKTFTRRLENIRYRQIRVQD